MSTALLSFASVLVLVHLASSSAVDPTIGFVELPLNASNFHNDKPYDLPVSDRYSFVDGVHKLWVYSTDEPLFKNSTTKPRSEIRIKGYDYSSGVWQFEGYGYVPTGTTGVCIMQVFGATPPRATTLMLRVYNGSLYYYRAGPVVLENIYEKWFRLNVIHDVNASKLQVYINGVLKLEPTGHGGKNHYFKFGVYSQNDSSYYMESRWKCIQVLRKTSTPQIENGQGGAKICKADSEARILSAYI
ncbi:citrate-binding protein-like [Durio zibethinus]|uniref:Citrate-binding protein-like n=1 Tax=Durio zibethinus TaxID=66656 RepID=A0A6P5YK32_DURZI|nr:citrate-binding protein-like [Durio zibethinus]